MLDLIELYSKVERDGMNKDQVRLSTILIPQHEPHRLGKDVQGRPLLLISIVDGTNQKQPKPIELEHLTVMYNMNCRVVRADDTIVEERFTVIQCTGEDIALHTYFLRIASTIINSLPNHPTQSDVSNAVNQLIELFRAMENVSIKSVRGLWAEMFLISQATNPVYLADAWHTIPEDRYDFAMDNQRIEVKSYTGDIRQHHFSLDQLHPPDGVIAVVVSVCVESSEAGLSVADIREIIQNQIGNNLDSLLHIDRIIARTLGDTWRQASEVFFDERVAEDSLAFYYTSSIPSVDPNLPSGISDVRFRSDLSNIDSATSSYLLSEGGLLGAVSC